MPYQDWGWSGNSTPTISSSSLAPASSPRPKARPWTQPTHATDNDNDNNNNSPSGYWTTVNVYKNTSSTEFNSFTDISIARPKFIQFDCTGLRPNTRHFVFFQGVEVSRFIKKDSTADFAGLTKGDPLRNPGDKYITENQYPAGLGGPTSEIFSEDDGSLKGYFYLQRGQADSGAAGVQFRTGVSNLEFVDISVLSREDALSYGQGSFTSNGGIENYTQNFYKVKSGTQRVFVPT
jgi:hypothetical protein